MKLPIIVSLVAAIGLTSACQQTIPKEALSLSPESLQMRQLQTRRFDTANEALLLSSSANLLQDLGFNLDESETKLGLVVGSKERDAHESGQVAGSIAMAVIFGVNVPYDTNQKIRASLVTRPISKTETSVRVTFQRVVWNSHNQISKLEALDDAKMYQEFFDKLSQSVFLTGHSI